MVQALHEVHPLLEAYADLGAALDRVADVQPAYASATDREAAMRLAARVEARVVELRLRVMAASNDVAMAHGARDVAGWYAHATRTSHEAARADLALALLLDRAQPVLAAAVREGEVTLAQAHVVARAVRDLPEALRDVTDGAAGAEVVARAEAHLVAEAERFGPRELRRLARRLLHTLAPHIADEAEARALDRLEQSAQQKTRMTMRRCGDGTTRISGVVPDAVGTRLATYLDAFANPRRHDAADAAAADDLPAGAPAADPVARLPYPRRLGQAFCRFLESVDPDRVPLHGGDATTVVVTIDFEALKADLATASLPAGTHVPGDAASDGQASRLTAAEARRLACTARILPMVLGGASVPLDVGRASRLFTPAQRKALLVRDGTCRAEGCDVPGPWCDAHHLRSWHEHRGPTDLVNGLLLCGHHHRRVHDPSFRHERLPDGTLRFHRRT